MVFIFVASADNSRQKYYALHNVLGGKMWMPFKPLSELNQNAFSSGVVVNLSHL